MERLCLLWGFNIYIIYTKKKNIYMNAKVTVKLL